VAKVEKVKKKIADIFDLPHDTVLGLPRVTLIGSHQLYIENHTGINLYEKNQIRVGVHKGEIQIDGEDLQLRTVYSDDIFIEGKIFNIFLKEQV